MADTVTISRDQWERIRKIAHDLKIDAKALHKLDEGRPLASHLLATTIDLVEELGG